MKYLVLDYETRSEADLRRVGAYKYSKHPSTRILCAAWRWGQKDKLRSIPTTVWSPALDKIVPLGLVMAFSDPDTCIIAHNAFFEQVMTKNVLARFNNIPNLPPERWLCTASMAAALALPRHLEGACLALDLPVKKDMDGRRLMLKMCKPRRATKNNDAKWHSSLADLKRLMEYCATDIAAEVELFLKIPELNPFERKVWLLDQKINWRGYRVDLPLIDTTLGMIESELVHLKEELSTVTKGIITTTAQRDRTLKFLRLNGLPIENLQAKTVLDTLKKDLPDVPRRVLEIRKSEGKTSTSKYIAFQDRADEKGFVRDHLMYHAASTGRWAGTGAQVHNLPRGTIKDTDLACEVLRTGDVEWVRTLYGDPMDTFSSCLRGMVLPPEGEEIFCADFSSIETRVLFWLAKHDTGLEAYEQNKDLYKEMAAIIFRKKPEEVTKQDRELGKRAILGCGYGMGDKKFHATCELYNQPVSEDLAKRAVEAYRMTHHPIPSLWYAIESAAIKAVQNPGKVFSLNQTSWCVKDDFLWCQLPSDRKLAYYKPTVKLKPMPWGEKKKTLYHWGVDPKIKRWMESGTYGGKLVENITQAVARDLMAEAMLRTENAGYKVMMTVHDEDVASRKIGEGDAKEFVDLMKVVPEWAAGLPIQAEGWKGPRYRK